jgi:hypothetical protein
MYEDDARFRRTISLLRAQQEASIDGILVVNEERRVVSCNRRFLDMWGIPDELARSGDDQRLIEHVLGKLRDPRQFVDRVMHLYANPHETSRDEIELLDGRCFDRYSAPAIGEEGESFGRVWLFRDMTERRTDLEQARMFQQSILPELPRLPGLELDVVYRPLDRVGGDLYHAVVEGSVLRLLVADATGHGVTAALSTMLLLREYEAAREAAGGPGEVLRALDARLSPMHARVGVRFTAVCADLDVERGELRWSSAAHPAPYLVRAGGAAVELSTGGSFLGVGPAGEFDEWSVRLEPGDALVVYTDGIVEAMRPDGRAFGEARLASALEAAQRAGAPLASAAAAAVDEFLARGRFADDATLLSARWRR